MVAKKSRIARNPKNKATTPDADQWIEEGGNDPEITTAKQPHTENQQGKKYPHRISFDMDKAQYKRLKYAAFDGDRSMNEILREATKEWLKARNY